MTIRRPRTPRPAMRHVSFLETMASVDAADPRHRAAHAVFLALRLFDQWLAFGAPASPSASRMLAATRDEIARLEVDAELHGTLARLTEAIADHDVPDAGPALPHLFTLGALLDARGQRAQAGDVFSLVAHHADPVAHVDLAYESLMRAGGSLRAAGELPWADHAFQQAAQLAGRDRDRLRVLLARLGHARVLWARGDLRAADAIIDDLIGEAEEAQSAAMTSRLLHERATLAWVRGDFEQAVRAAFRAFDLAPDAQERAAILTALACYLEGLDASDAAQVARGAIDLNRLATSRPVPRTAESDRATSIELARAIAEALRGPGGAALA